MSPIDRSHPYSIVTIKRTVHLPWMPFKTGPGTLEVQGDANRLFRTNSDKAIIATGLVSIEFVTPKPVQEPELVKPVVAPKPEPVVVPKAKIANKVEAVKPAPKPEPIKPAPVITPLPADEDLGMQDHWGPQNPLIDN
jgi:hypothetical protein